MQNLKEMLECRAKAAMPYQLDIQLFADDPVDPPNDPTDPPVDPPNDPPSDPPSLTQKDIDDAIAAAKAQWEEEQQVQQTEAQKLAKMTKEQREDYEKKQKEETLLKREADLNKRELTTTAKETLASKGLPVALAEALNYENAEACNKSIETIGKAFQDAVQTAVAARIAGTDPMKKSQLAQTKTTLTKEAIEKMTPKEINENWDEIQEVMKNL